MIRVNRGPQPQTLVTARNKRLKAAVAAFNTHGPGSAALLKLLDGYQIAKKELFLRQHKKCAYCERLPGFDGQPVEHFRSKKHAIRGPKTKPTKDTERYWWLTWTWDNLMFACTTCNGQARKGNRFPLAAKSTPLITPTRPASLPLPVACFTTSAERPLLLDPSNATVDPLDHLRWLPIDRTLPRSQWTWRLHAFTEAGVATRRHLGLTERVDDVGSRYRETVWPRFREEVDRKLATTTPAQLRAAFSRLTGELVQPNSDLTAATWSMLAELGRSTTELRAAGLPEPPRP